jgi:hypothetical protein
MEPPLPLGQRAKLCQPYISRRRQANNHAAGCRATLTPNCCPSVWTLSSGPLALPFVPTLDRPPHRAL